MAATDPTGIGPFPTHIYAGQLQTLYELKASVSSARVTRFTSQRAIQGFKMARACIIDQVQVM
ncbi:hypothetical protein PF010_g25526 [Phytophthora fragariae]|uniref:Uncharacterized protein n=1 Tax=Phytophthora fragariae TaxID=53985 RepID=A0A6G0K0B9_9STRA|nr:hypothetical protein PF010_g25526 [Phytophthora fragariae]KAE9180234.1 hypothetical protein PF004_g24899 [Phytophthora fragariae]KAE9290548.1 hypothetical protein PF008_g25571 [Phytophthora fragariae]